MAGAWRTVGRVEEEAALAHLTPQKAQSELCGPSNAPPRTGAELEVWKWASPFLPQDACWALGNTHPSELAFQASAHCSWLPDLLGCHLMSEEALRYLA